MGPKWYWSWDFASDPWSHSFDPRSRDFHPSASIPDSGLPDPCLVPVRGFSSPVSVNSLQWHIRGERVGNTTWPETLWPHGIMKPGTRQPWSYITRYYTVSSAFRIIRFETRPNPHSKIERNAVGVHLLHASFLWETKVSNIYIQFFFGNFTQSRPSDSKTSTTTSEGKKCAWAWISVILAGKRDNSYSGGKKLSKLMYSTTELQDTKKCLRHQGLLDSYPVPILISPLMEESRGRLPS